MPARQGQRQLPREPQAVSSEAENVALNDIMERDAGQLVNYLVRSLQTKEDAAYAAQETFVRVHQNRTKFDPSQRISTWLYAIATRRPWRRASIAPGSS